MSPSSISLVVTTYNSEQALGLVLASVARQTRLPDEVIVADDGSGAATRAGSGQLYDISLAQWSLHRSLQSRQIDNLDFAGGGLIDNNGDAITWTEMVGLVIKADDGRADNVNCGTGRDKADVDSKDDLKSCERLS